MNVRKPLNALFLGAPNPLSVGVISAWLLAGNRAEAIWYPERMKTERSLQKDAQLAGVNPYLSMAGLKRLFEVEFEAVPRISTNPELVTMAKNLKVDVVLSVMYMDIIPQAMIDVFQGRLLNIHPSLLPAYRGPSPILNMLWDEKVHESSGLTLHEVTAQVDEGAIVGSVAVPFPVNCSIVDYMGALIFSGGKLLCDSVPAYLDGTIIAAKQPLIGASYRKVKRSQLSIASIDSLKRVRWLCQTVGQFAEFKIKDAAFDVRVSRLAGVLGRPTGAPMAFTDGWAELDLADARVRLSRSEIG